MTFLAPCKPLLFAAIGFLALQGSLARPSEDLIQPSTPTHVGRHLLGGPAQAGCDDAGLSCCYDPGWWLAAQVAPSVTCLAGTLDSSVDAAFLLQACADGAIGEYTTCNQNFCQTISLATVDCGYYENIGDYTGNFPCTSNEFNGQTIEVYDQFDLKGNNDEVVWADASVANNEPTGIETCNTPGGSYTLTATYSTTSSWNVGIQLGAKLFSNYEAKLTAGYSQSYSKGTNAGVTVATTEGQHATVTAGTLMHHTIGWWDVKLNTAYKGCSEYRIDNVAADLIMPTSDPNFPTDYGVEVKPCGYPLMNGHLD